MKKSFQAEAFSSEDDRVAVDWLSDDRIDGRGFDFESDGR